MAPPTYTFLIAGGMTSLSQLLLHFASVLLLVAKLIQRNACLEFL
jgi:hypothetical protein